MKKDTVLLTIMASIIVAVFVIKSPILEGIVVVVTMLAWLLYGIYKKDDPGEFYPPLFHSEKVFFLAACEKHIKRIFLEEFIFRATFVGNPKRQRGLTYFLGFLGLASMVLEISGLSNISMPLVYTYTGILALLVIARGWVRINQMSQIIKVASDCSMSYPMAIYYIRTYYTSYHKTKYIK